MTDSLFFDSDCLSAFLWVGKENLLVLLYPGKVVIPKAVYDELSCPGIAQLKAKIDVLLTDKLVTIATIDINTEAFDLYYQMTVEPTKGRVVIGKGEAASIALAKAKNGIVASNNLKDITSYIKEFDLTHVTTGDILIEACRKKFITEEQGNLLWTLMLAKRRKLGAISFSVYLQSKGVVL